MATIDMLKVLNALGDDSRFSDMEKLVIRNICRDYKEKTESFSKILMDTINEQEQRTSQNVQMVYIDRKHENLFAIEILGVHGQLGLSVSERPRDLFPDTLYGYNVTWGAKEFKVV